MYAGTGEGYFREEIRGTGLPLRGGGIFVTSDGGLNWQPPASHVDAGLLWVNDLELGVNDSRRIYAATRTGVWRSQDGGGTWRQLLAVNVRGGCLDLALRPDRRRTCCSRRAARTNRPRSIDSRAPPTRAAVEIVLQRDHHGPHVAGDRAVESRLDLRASASNERGPGGNYRQGLLAVYRSSRAAIRGIWEARVDQPRFEQAQHAAADQRLRRDVRRLQPRRSRTTSPTWVGITTSSPSIRAMPIASGRPAWTGSDRTMAGGRGAWRDWGASRRARMDAHVDQHAIAFHPQYDGSSNQIAMIGNDGGIFRTTNARAATKHGPLRAMRRRRHAERGVDVAQSRLRRDAVLPRHRVSGRRALSRRRAGQRHVVRQRSEPVLKAGGCIFGGDGGYTRSPSMQTGRFSTSNCSGPRCVDRTIPAARSSSRPQRPRPDPLVDARPGGELSVRYAVRDGSRTRRRGCGSAANSSIDRRTARPWTKVGAPMPDGGLISALAVRPGQSAHLVDRHAQRRRALVAQRHQQPRLD